jgi:hypothetical protein
MARTINVNKTVTFAQDVFTYLAGVAEKTDVSFTDALNALCRDGIAAREKQEDQ